MCGTYALHWTMMSLPIRWKVDTKGLDSDDAEKDGEDNDEEDDDGKDEAVDWAATSSPAGWEREEVHA